jgi:hypothetical protein
VITLADRPKPEIAESVLDLALRARLRRGSGTAAG